LIRRIKNEPLSLLSWAPIVEMQVAADGCRCSERGRGPIRWIGNFHSLMQLR
jgi:hypothetical protein